ncbi:tyrosine-type recombinase/integrase [bacterium]|nr:tyrosine-type recombinase/integrase [bacterium]
MGQITNPDFKEKAELFTEDLRSKNRSESTVIAYSKDIEQLLNFLSQRGIDSLDKTTAEDLQAYKQNLQDNSYTLKSISRKINSTRTFFRYLFENGYVKDNVSEKLAHPRFEMKPPRVLSEMEYRALRDVSRIDIRLYSIVEILLQTGIRIGELANLSLEDIRQSKDGRISYLYIKPAGSHGARKVPLNRSAKAAIDEYLKVRPETEEETVFVTKNGRPLLVRNIRTAIDKSFEKAGIKNAKVNDLRNTFIAHHLINGVSLAVVSKLVGHKRISTTEKYLTVINVRVKEEENLKEL